MRWMFLFLAPLLSLAAAAQSATPPLLARYAGHVVYVDFWASWCGPCAKSFPWLNALQAKFAAQGLKIVGVSVDTDEQAADRFLQQHPAQFDILRDPAGRLAERYRLEGMPSALILDGTGHVVHRHVGFRDAETADYEAAVRQALALDGSGTQP